MKRLSLKSGIFIFFSLFAIQSFSHAVTFYGFDSIEHYQGRSNGAFFIQMGNFSGRLNANHYQEKMQQKISYPIKLERKGGNYVVMVGPLRSMGQVREVVAQARSRFVQRKIPQKSSFLFSVVDKSKMLNQ